MLLSKLFENCAWNVKYETVGLDTNYAFVEQGSHLYIYFAGSKAITEKDGWIDWFRNFWFWPVYRRPYKDMKIPYKVHSGFLAAWKEVHDIINAKITEKDEDGEFKFTRITIVGYSHGGALAMLCTENCNFWRKDIKDSIMGYGFEAPRVYHGCIFGGVKKELINRWSNFYVIRNCKDLVTHCPPKLFGFKHVGTMIKIGKKSAGLIKDHFPENVRDALIEYEREL